MNINESQIIQQAREIFELDSISIVETRNNINSDFAKAVELISEAKRVFVSGIGKSGIIARKISATFASIGIPSYFLHPVEALHGDIGMIEMNDVLILLSKSGGTEEIVCLIPYLKSRNAKIIAIVGNMDSFLSRNSDIVLNGSVAKEACPFNLAPTTSTLVALAIGDALAVCAMKYKDVNLNDFSRNHPLGQIGRNITLQVKDVMHKGNTLPTVNSKATFRDSIIEITDKGLGCVCIMDEEHKLIGVITDGDVRRTLQTHDDIRQLKAVDVMTKTPVTVIEDIYLGDALAVMVTRESQINILPVVDGNGKVVGIVRMHDIVRSGI